MLLWLGELLNTWKKKEVTKSQAFFCPGHLSDAGPQLREQRASCHETSTREESTGTHATACSGLLAYQEKSCTFTWEKKEGNWNLRSAYPRLYAEKSSGVEKDFFNIFF